MAILAVCGHPSETTGSSAIVAAPGPAYVSPHMKNYIGVASGGGRVFKLPAGINDAWLSWYMSRVNTAAGATLGFTVADNQGTDIARVASNGGNIALRRNNSGTYSIVGQGPFPYDKAMKFDLRIKLGTSAGELTMFLDGTQVASFTGNVNGGAASISTVTMRPLQIGAVSTFVSGLIVSDSDTRDLVLIDYEALGNGPLNEWTGDYTSLDKTLTVGDPNSWLTVDADNQTQLFSTDFSQLASETVHALIVSGQARERVADEAPIVPVIRTSDGVSIEGGPINAGVAWESIQHVFNREWSYSELESASFGFKSVLPT